MRQFAAIPGLTVRASSFDVAHVAGFTALCDRLYAGDPSWVSRRPATMAQFAPEHRFYRRSDRHHRHFAAVRGDEVIGHVSAFLNPRMLDFAGLPVGCVGIFECVEEYPVAKELLGAAVGWLRERHGVTRIRGPVDFDIWSAYRFKRSGFERGTFLGEPHNKPYYPEYFERFGFRVRKEWRSTELRGRRTLEAVIAKSESRYRRTVDAGYRFSPLEAAQVEDRRALHALVSRSYDRFLGFTPIEFADFDQEIGTRLQAVDSRFVALVQDPSGAPAGFSLAFPDSADRIVCHTIGITPEEIEKRHGLGSAISFHMIRTILDAGFERVLVALVAEDSPVRAIGGARMDETDIEYALYEIEP